LTNFPKSLAESLGVIDDYPATLRPVAQFPLV